MTAFDGIIYAKGEAVLEMIEAWLGEQPLRSGVVGFVERHAWKSATAADFLSAAADALALAPALASDSHWRVVQAGIRLVRSLEPLVPEGELPRYEVLIRERFGPRARELRWSARAGEDDDTRLLRAALVPFVAEDGKDTSLGGEALALARGWLETGQGVDADVAAAVLGAAVQHGDASFFERVKQATLAETDRRRRALLLQALRRAPSEELFAQTLALTLDERLDAREAAGLLFGSNRRRSSQAATLEFARRNFEALAKRLPREWLAGFAWIGSDACDPRVRQELQAFFAPRLAATDGGPQSLAQALEVVDQCIARRERHAAGVAAFLQEAAAATR